MDILPFNTLPSFRGVDHSSRPSSNSSLIWRQAGSAGDFHRNALVALITANPIRPDACGTHPLDERIARRQSVIPYLCPIVSRLHVRPNHPWVVGWNEPINKQS